LIVSLFVIVVSILAIYSTIAASEYGLKKDDMQVQSLIHLVKSSNWLNDYEELHTDKSVEGSLANLQHKVEVENSAYEKSLLNISEASKIITTYELITILLIIGAGLGGISEIAKNKLIGYPGSAEVIILLLFLFTGSPI
jgi:hypothetical protein